MQSLKALANDELDWGAGVWKHAPVGEISMQSLKGLASDELDWGGTRLETRASSEGKEAVVEGACQR
jgi:hypothetical protein